LAAFWRDGVPWMSASGSAAGPPLGWYRPEGAASWAEVNSIDIVEGLVIESGPQVEVLNLIQASPTSSSQPSQAWGVTAVR
jgi:hypothetical protein